MLNLGQTTWQRISSILNTIPTDDEGSLVRGGEASEVFTEVSGEMLNSYQSPSYNSAIASIKNGLSPLREEIASIYLDDPNIIVSDEILQQSVSLVGVTEIQIDNELGKAGFEAEVINPTMNALEVFLANQSQKTTMLSGMQSVVTNSLKNFTDLRAFTILEQYGRKLNDLFGQTFARRVKLIGPKDNRNRDFCSDRIAEGRTFTIEEVADWPANYAPWPGMIPGTDKASIFVNLGGFQCRHHFQYLKT